MKVGILASTANQVTDFYLGNQVIRNFEVPVILVRRMKPRGARGLFRKVGQTMAADGARAVVTSARDWSFERRRQQDIRGFLQERFARIGEKPEYDKGPRIIEVDDSHDQRSLDILREAGVAVLFQNGAGILHSPLIRLAPRGVINVHHGYLPDIRGCQSIAWGLLEDHPEWIGVSVHLIDEGIDTGPVLKRRHLTAAPGDTYPKLFAKATLLGGQLLIEALTDLSEGHRSIIPGTSPGVYRSAMTRRHWIALARKTAVDHTDHSSVCPTTDRSHRESLPPDPSLSVRWHDTLDSPELSEAWDRLCRTDPSASLFTTPQWCRCWMETVGATARPAIPRVVDGNGQTIGLLPLCVHRAGLARWLRFMGRERVSGDHLDLLALPGQAGRALSAILLDLTERTRDFDGILLGELQPTSQLRSEVIAWAKSHGYAWHEREHRLVPFLNLPDSFEDVLAVMSSNMRHQVRRRRRGLASMAEARTELIDSADRIDETLAHFFQLHELRWEKDGRPGNFRDPAIKAFLRRFCQTAAEQGWLRLHVLRVRGEPHAVLVAFHRGRTAYYYQMGWNPHSPVTSPGVVLLAESVEQAIREGLARYDFLRGDESYKFRWTTQYTQQTTLAIACHQTARMMITSEQIKRRLKPSIQRCLGERNWERIRQVVKDCIP